MSEDPLDELTAGLHAAAERLRTEELDAPAAAALVDECARLASEAAAELDRRVRAAGDVR